MKKECHKIIMRMKKKKNRSIQGSALNVVLVLFMMLFASLLSLGVVYTNALEVYRIEKSVNRQREIQVYLRQYFRKTMDESLLISNTHNYHHGKLHYTVTSLGDYYEIECEIEENGNKYSYQLDIEVATLNVKKFVYK